jgi:hypothetical protein
MHERQIVIETLLATSSHNKYISFVTCNDFFYSELFDQTTLLGDFLGQAISFKHH